MKGKLEPENVGACHEPVSSVTPSPKDKSVIQKQLDRGIRNLTLGAIVFDISPDL